MKVIIPAWLKDDQLVSLTEATVNSLKGHELVIIDNGSPMGGGLLREWADVYIRNKVNINYSGAVNQGLKLCGGLPWVCVANNDIKVPSYWDKVAEEILQNPEVCSVHFRMIPYDQPFNPGDETWIGGKEKWCSSSFFVVRPIQFYDPKLKNSYDDYDFWYRFRKAGFKQAYTNKAEYQHLDSSSSQKLPEHNENNKRNYEYYKQKHGEYPDIQFTKMFPEQVDIPWKPFP